MRRMKTSAKRETIIATKGDAGWNPQVGRFRLLRLDVGWTLISVGQRGKGARGFPGIGHRPTSVGVESRNMTKIGLNPQNQQHVLDHGLLLL